eukprot:11310603-Prorocentrum_lima.AAC.1
MRPVFGSGQPSKPCKTDIFPGPMAKKWGIFSIFYTTHLHSVSACKMRHRGGSPEHASPHHRP